MSAEGLGPGGQEQVRRRRQPEDQRKRIIRSLEDEILHEVASLDVRKERAKLHELEVFRQQAATWDDGDPISQKYFTNS